MATTSSASAAETHRFDPKVGAQSVAVREPVLSIDPGDRVETARIANDVEPNYTAVAKFPKALLPTAARP